jgi:uncharacterized membrane protein YdfJ with MMPL/SSD domain
MSRWLAHLALRRHIVSRYREELQGGASHADALVTALDTAGHAVVF